MAVLAILLNCCESDMDHYIEQANGFLRSSANDDSHVIIFSKIDINNVDAMFAQPRNRIVTINGIYDRFSVITYSIIYGEKINHNLIRMYDSSTGSQIAFTRSGTSEESELRKMISNLVTSYQAFDTDGVVRYASTLTSHLLKRSSIPLSKLANTIRQIHLSHEAIRRLLIHHKLETTSQEDFNDFYKSVGEINVKSEFDVIEKCKKELSKYGIRAEPIDFMHKFLLSFINMREGLKGSSPHSDYQKLETNLFLWFCAYCASSANQLALQRSSSSILMLLRCLEFYMLAYLRRKNVVTLMGGEVQLKKRPRFRFEDLKKAFVSAKQIAPTDAVMDNITLVQAQRNASVLTHGFKNSGYDADLLSRSSNTAMSLIQQWEKEPDGKLFPPHFFHVANAKEIRRNLTTDLLDSISSNGRNHSGM